MRKNIFKLALIAAGVITLFISCSKSSSGGGSTPTTAPKVGSKWVFKHTDYNESGAATATQTFTLVASSYSYGGSTWLLLSDQSSGTPVTALQKRADGWWQLPLPNTTPSLFYKTPAAVNDQYLNNISDGTTDTAKVNGLNVSLTVPAGTFSNCTYIKSYDTNSLEEEYWFSDGPIMIQTTEYDERSTGGMFMAQKLELVSYTP